MSSASPPLPTSPESLLPIVLQAMAATPDARLRRLMASLTTHLHRFVIENAVTEPEWERAMRFLIDIGQATNATHNEVILASDLLGVSTLVALLNNPGAAPAVGHTHGTPSGGGDGDTAPGASHAALLGPFWRAEAPWCEPGESIVRGPLAGLPLSVQGVVRGADGQALAGAVVDVWQASPVGLYENQDPAQPDMNLRGRFRTDNSGRYHLRTVRPAGYPVPTHGPCGALLKAQQRHPFRPAHLHFMVSHPGHKVLITQVFADDAETLHSDPVFGVTAPLVGHFETVEVDGASQARLTHDFQLSAGEPVFPDPPIA